MKQIEIGRKRNGRWILPIGSNVLVPSLSLSYVWEGHVDHSQSPQLLPLCVCMWLALGISPLSELSRWGVFYFFEGKERLVMLYTLFSQPTHIHTHTRWFQFPPILCVCVCTSLLFFSRFLSFVPQKYFVWFGMKITSTTDTHTFGGSKNLFEKYLYLL